MRANEPVSDHAVKSDLQRVDAHGIAEGEFDDLPEPSDAMLKRGTVKRDGAPFCRIQSELSGGCSSAPRDSFANHFMAESMKPVPPYGRQLIP